MDKNQPIKTLYLGNLAWQITKEDIKAFFKSFGSIIAIKIVKDAQTGRSKGYGFITMENAEAAKKQLNGQVLCGRALKINSVVKDYPAVPEKPEQPAPKFYIPSTQTYC